MSNLTKQDIIEEIQRTARENDGKPLGEIKFADITGIKIYDWRKYWARFSDAQKEAGFIPNTLNKAYDEEFIIKKMIGLIRKLGKFPVHGELRIEKNVDPSFPSSDALFTTKIQKCELAKRISEWCTKNSGYEDIVEHCSPILEERHNKTFDKDISKIFVGEVYLYKMSSKMGRYYKIGKSFDTVRRGKELRTLLPEKITLIHSIKTDDPSGVEAYWHKRFESKRMEGEWFDLNTDDIKAFKRWRRIV